MPFTMPFPSDTWVRIPWGIEPEDRGQILDSIGGVVDDVDLPELEADSRAQLKKLWLNYVARALDFPSGSETVNRVLRLVDDQSADYCQVDVNVLPAMSREDLRTHLTVDNPQDFRAREVLDTDVEFAGVTGMLGRSVLPLRRRHEIVGLNKAFALETELYTVLGFALPSESVVIEFYTDTVIGQARTHDDVAALLSGARLVE